MHKWLEFTGLCKGCKGFVKRATAATTQLPLFKFGYDACLTIAATSGYPHWVQCH